MCRGRVIMVAPRGVVHARFDGEHDGEHLVVLSVRAGTVIAKLQARIAQQPRITEGIRQVAASWCSAKPASQNELDKSERQSLRNAGAQTRRSA